MPRVFILPAILCGMMTAVQGWAGIPCFAPQGEWITGADLAAATPALAGLPMALRVSYAPVPGLTRIFHPDELRRLARAQGLPDPGLKVNVCSAWPLAPLAIDKILKAMQQALTGHSPQIEVVNQSKADAPAGEVVFPLAGLSGYSENAVIWRGYIQYAGTRRFETWASARVRVHETHLMAHGSIHAGERLSPARWIAEAYTGPLLRERILGDGAELEGLVARRDFADGAPLLVDFFETPKAVERGDVVTVVAGFGAAQIEAPGEALAAGGRGEVILIRNPRSNRTFKARISSPGRVEVLPGTSAGLAGSETLNGNSL
jgi:flagella basal body P-ring formation protein FlgA